MLRQLTCYKCGQSGRIQHQGRNCRVTRCIGSACFKELTQPYILVDGEHVPPPALESFDKERRSKTGCGKCFHMPCLERPANMANMPRVLYYRTDKATGERVPSGWAEVRFRLQHLLCEDCLAEACPGETIVFNQETEEQARAKRARLDDKHASKLRKRLAAGLEKLDQLGSVCVGHAVSRSGNVSLFKSATAAELHHSPLDKAEAELRAQLKMCAAAASRAEDPAPAEGGEQGRAGAAGESAPAAATAAAVEQAAAAVAAAEAAAAAMAQAAAAGALAEAPAQGASSAAVLPAGAVAAAPVER